MNLKLFTATCALATAATTASAATYVIGGDARPRAAGGRVVTDAYVDATNAFAADVRHFGYALAPSANNALFTSNPGFNAVVGSGLAASQQLRFDFVRRLVRWDGVGTVRFLDLPGDERLRFSTGATGSTVTGATDTVAGYPIGNVASDGSIHRHLNATLSRPDAAAPAAGLYFAALRLSVSGGTLARGDALYVAYNNGLAAADFERGMQYLANPTGGDANFDARVDFADLVALAQNYGAAGEASHFDGDFDRDRAVGFSDLVTLAQNYGVGSATASASSFAGDWALAQAMAAVAPEPAALALGSFLFVLARRRRD